ncbi:aminopeptidase [Halorarius halobius]|uniref:aminopeptidase n=1 Tax=Halorarius halobius TaxID=2962671 RepID=UPI0020CE3159|nr:aminopeptidase [Halorarius halobius]
MDPRISRHAEILVDYCTDVGADDDVLVTAPPAAEDLVVALYEKLGEHGARPKTAMSSSRAGRAYARAMDVDQFRTKEHALAEMEATDVAIFVQAGRNASETSDVDPGKSTASRRADQPILEERLDSTRWVITQHPTPADAQRAEMSTAAWTDYVYDAIDRDWADLRAFQERLAAVLDDASEVRIVADGTDVRMSVEGMAAASDHGKRNMPGGEVFTSPVVDSVEGEVTFDVPLYRDGREIRDVRLVFEDGEVVDYGAAAGEAVVEGVLDTDAGARRVGELGIGTNQGVDTATGNLLFDEKMGDTVHLALGTAMEECVPDDREFNQSAAHVDMLVDVSEDARVEVDGEPFKVDGEFVV